MRKFLINVNGNSYEVEVEELGASSAPVQAAPAQRPTPAAPAQAAPAKKAAAPANGTKVESPMPGTILDIKAANGSNVNEGDTIAILEAMKMENEILAPCAGKVTISVEKGATVDTGDLIAVIG